MSPEKGNTPNDAKSPPQTQRATLSMTPQRSTAYASTKTPIMSAKRPKKLNPKLKTGSSAHSVLRTPEAGIQAIRTENKLCSTLSPMHNVRPVPRDSHHVPTAHATTSAESDGSAVDACASKLSIETALYTNIVNKDEDVDIPSASWVGRKVDAIFSPVLSFLQNTSGDCSNEGKLGRSLAQPMLEELGSSTHSSEDSYDNAADVSSLVREALSQVESDAHKDGNRSAISINGVPTTTNKNSSEILVDVDGDVTMADYKLHLSQEENVRPDPVVAHEYFDQKLHIDAASGSSVTEEGYDDDEEEEFNPYLFIKCLPPYQHAIPSGWTSRPKALPPLDYAVLPPIPPICLVLDLDETLVHCTVEPVANADMIFPVEFNGTEYQVHVRCRPFLQEFLEAVSRKFEVVIFTASQQVYADKLLDKIDPEGKFIRHRMFRDSCLQVEGNFLKDLTILGRDLSKAVLVDNSPHAFGYQVDNGIPIESWFDDLDDKELLKLEMFLRTLHGVDDVRDVVRKTFQTHQLVLDA